MGFVVSNDAAEFRDLAWPLIEDRLEYNVIATIILAVLEGRRAAVEPIFVYRLDGGRVDAVALRTPPYPMIATELDPASADELMDVWLHADPALPGANSAPATARALADAWRRRTGRSTRISRSMAMHALESVVDPPRPAAGRLRLGDRSERPLLIDWWRAFALEVDIPGAPHADVNVDARLDAGSVFVWDDGGPVSLLAVSPQVAGVVRIGPVYTPPERRRRGYAGIAVAEVSRHALANGASRCMLYTDLANPTSNKIYAEIGYRRLGDWEEHVFDVER